MSTAKALSRLLRKSFERFADPEFEPPLALMDKPNVTVYPVLVEEEVMPKPNSLLGGHSPLGDLSLQLSDEAMQMVPGGDPMAGGGMPQAEAPMDAGLAQLMGGGMPGANPEEQMLIPGDVG